MTVAFASNWWNGNPLAFRKTVPGPQPERSLPQIFEWLVPSPERSLAQIFEWLITTREISTTDLRVTGPPPERSLPQIFEWLIPSPEKSLPQIFEWLVPLTWEILTTDFRVIDHHLRDLYHRFASDWSSTWEISTTKLRVTGPPPENALPFFSMILSQILEKAKTRHGLQL
jgi:hypothetical protein